MQVKNKQDFWSGLMFIVLGLGFAWKAQDYALGTAARMGPGYFPFWLGLILAALGALVTWSSMSKRAVKTEIDKFHFKVLGIIVVSVIVFASLLEPLGLYFSLFLLVISCSLAGHDFSLKVAVANGIFLVIFCHLAFIKGLGLIFPLWPSFLQAN